jgi:polar amino acid transport system permease protein
LQSIPKSQLEAAHCLGMHPFHVFAFVQLPLAVANVYPAIVGQFTIIVLNSSAASAIGMNDLAGAAGYIQPQTLWTLEIYIIATRSISCWGWSSTSSSSSSIRRAFAISSLNQ